MLPLHKNDIIELAITATSSEGMGIGRYEGVAVFVAHAAQGDLLKVRIVKLMKNFVFGKIEEILVSSPDRIEQDCPVAPRCGGCVFRHISYKKELEIKRDRVEQAFSRIGGLEIETLPVIGAQYPDRYRNKAQYPVGIEDGMLKIGFYSPRSHRINHCLDCLLQPENFQKILETVEKWIEQYSISVYDERAHAGLLRHIYIRHAEATGELMVCLVVNGTKIPHTEELIEYLRAAEPDIAGIVLNINQEDTNVILGKKCITLWGKETITDQLCGLRFRISPLSFYQVNRSQAERLYETAAQYAGLTGNEIVLDLYCGAGTIGLSMAHRAKEVIGVEIISQAVDNAKENAKENGIHNARFFCKDAAEAAKQLKKEGMQPDVVILDPPRKGCGEKLVQTVVGMNPKRIVYVSCDPATMARDLKWFDALGYSAQTAQPVDMFPRTKCVETVVLLSKLKVDHHIEIELKMDELDLTAAESKATYDEIKAYVLNKYGLKVSQLYIAQIKRKCGIIERKNYNVSKKEDAKVPQCPPEKEAAIMDALKHFQMI